MAAYSNAHTWRRPMACSTPMLKQIAQLTTQKVRLLPGKYGTNKNPKTPRAR